MRALAHVYLLMALLAGAETVQVALAERAPVGAAAAAQVGSRRFSCLACRLATLPHGHGHR
jgi:hypothetical protein